MDENQYVRPDRVKFQKIGMKVLGSWDDRSLLIIGHNGKIGKLVRWEDCLHWDREYKPEPPWCRVRSGWIYPLDREHVIAELKARIDRMHTVCLRPQDFMSFPDPDFIEYHIRELYYQIGEAYIMLSQLNPKESINTANDWDMPDDEEWKHILSTPEALEARKP